MRPTYHKRSKMELLKDGAATSARLAAVAGAALLISGAVTYGCAKLTELDFDEEAARRAAENEGWSDPTLTETNRVFPWLQGCGEGDAIGYEMTATSQTGNITELVVCTGPFKAASVRQR